MLKMKKVGLYCRGRLFDWLLGCWTPYHPNTIGWKACHLSCGKLQTTWSAGRWDNTFVLLHCMLKIVNPTCCNWSVHIMAVTCIIYICIWMQTTLENNGTGNRQHLWLYPLKSKHQVWQTVVKGSSAFFKDWSCHCQLFFYPVSFHLRIFHLLSKMLLRWPAEPTRSLPTIRTVSCEIKTKVVLCYSASPKRRTVPFMFCDGPWGQEAKWSLDCCPAIHQLMLHQQQSQVQP